MSGGQQSYHIFGTSFQKKKKSNKSKEFNVDYFKIVASAVCSMKIIETFDL